MAPGSQLMRPSITLYPEVAQWEDLGSNSGFAMNQQDLGWDVCSLAHRSGVVRVT